MPLLKFFSVVGLTVFHVYVTTAKFRQCLILLISGNYCFWRRSILAI